MTGITIGGGTGKMHTARPIIYPRNPAVAPSHISRMPRQYIQTEMRMYNPYTTQQQWNSGFDPNTYQSYYGNVPQANGNFGNYEPAYFHPQNNYPKSHEVLQNPLHYYEDSYSAAAVKNQQQNYMNPYPKQSFIPQKQGGMKSFMNSFKSQDGSLDFNKMMDTAGMMMNAMNQVTGLVKGVGGIFKV